MQEAITGSIHACIRIRATSWALNHKIIAELNLQRYPDAIEAADQLLQLNPNNQKGV
jgi:hypothetical protein